MRQINLGFDFFFAACRTRDARRGTLRFSRAADIGPHFFCLMLLQRTGMRLFLGHPDMRQRVENRFALHFQFPGKIVDSNLTHPAFLFPALC
jgi:hypothetical protein